MQLLRILSSCLVAGALVGAPITASAAPDQPTGQAAPMREASTAAVADANHYAELEKQSPEAATFEGGGQGVYIGGSALTLVVIILLLVIIL